MTDARIEPNDDSEPAFVGHSAFDIIRRNKLELLSEREAALTLGRPERSLIELRKAGDGPDYVLIGRAHFYRIEAIKAWLERRERPAKSAMGS
ncbi:MAG TPA: hypothetical protein VIU82_01855 [Bosea sp. (in: a-proteobacteria)]